MAAPLQLPNKTDTPPGGWKFRVDKTGQEFTEPSIDSLIQKLRAHYKANGYIEPPDLQNLIEDYVCNKQPDYCVESTGFHRSSFRPGLAHTFHVVIQGTKTLGSWIGSGFEKVPMAQAESRAAVCAGCVENQEPEGCTGCNIGALRELTDRIAGSQKTAHDDSLKACRICSCQLKAKTRLPHKVLWPHMTDTQKAALPEHCWLLSEAPKS